ncbi:Flavin reductase domain protein FMN-binding protein [metagenome]|uniref:Flavin reductase domain protein FMN-binding protein n=1 Tax=metagenome TaxID=256318 RepID=A0A2P2C2B1_9ZZZZ
MTGTTNSGTSQQSAIDATWYREVMGHYPTGVVVVTGTADDDEPIGMVVGTFVSVSLDPPLVSFMPTKTSETFQRLRTASAYCVNVLAFDQVELCRTMASRKPGKFDSVAWSTSPLGAPVLTDAVAHIHCVPIRSVEAGDHYIALCEVRAMEVNRPVTPLLFFQGGYGGFSPQTMSAKTDVALIAAVRLSEVAQPQIERLARQFRCEASVLVAVGDEDLMTTASAYGGGTQMREPIGQRIPLIPPIGETYVAWAGEAVIEHWLARAADQSELALSKHQRRLASLRAQGWAMARVGPEGEVGYAALLDALQEYSAGALTPARARAVRAVIAESSYFYDSTQLDDAVTYDLGSLSVPVVNPDGSASLVLRLMQLPTGVSASEVRGWVEALRNAADTVARKLREQDRAGLDEYLQWFQAEIPIGLRDDSVL